jgi:TRAP-type C4-dicarboxylate transport system substrate-binding protein
MDELSPGPITEPIWTRLTPEDHAAFTELASQAECTVAQLARYALRRFLAEKIKEASREN